MLIIIYGFISGMVSGLGMGGGSILILLLSTFMGMEQHTAQATNLIFFIPTSLVAMSVHIKQKNIDKGIVTRIAIFGMIGAVIGAIISGKMESGLLKKAFAIFILFIGCKEMFNLYKEYKLRKKKT